MYTSERFGREHNRTAAFLLPVGATRTSRERAAIVIRVDLFFASIVRGPCRGDVQPDQFFGDFTRTTDALARKPPRGTPPSGRPKQSFRLSLSYARDPTTHTRPRTNTTFAFAHPSDGQKRRTRPCRRRRPETIRRRRVRQERAGLGRPSFGPAAKRLRLNPNRNESSERIRLRTQSRVPPECQDARV